MHSEKNVELYYLECTGTFKYLHPQISCAIAQAVSRLLPTVAAQVRSCGICGGQSGIGAGFLKVIPFPLPILIPPTAPHSSSIIHGWYNRPLNGQHTKYTQSHPNPRKLTELHPQMQYFTHIAVKAIEALPPHLHYGGGGAL
jgi:hypothetical protein